MTKVDNDIKIKIILYWYNEKDVQHTRKAGKYMKINVGDKYGK